MYKQAILQKFMRSELARYEKLYSKLERRLEKLPKGTLCNQRGKLCCHMRINGKQYITTIKNDDKLISELKDRRYIKKCLPLLKKKINLFRNFLEQDFIYNPVTVESELPIQYHGIQNLDIFLEGKINLKKWLKSGNKNPAKFLEVHYTANKVKCRSKSEALIGSCLESRGILYIYEPEIRLKYKNIYPDFAIYLPKSGRVIYLEHFGQIDNPKYRVRNFNKFAEYATAGIYVGINFFYTTETHDAPLTTYTINRIIDEILELDR